MKDIQKRHLDRSHSIIHIQDYPTLVFLKTPSPSNPLPLLLFENKQIIKALLLEQDTKIY